MLELLAQYNFLRYFCHPVDENGEEVPSNHNILPEGAKNLFKGKNLCCYFYKELPKDVEENMFQLVQRGVPLSPAEKMRAMSTAWADFAKQYEKDYSLVVNCKCLIFPSGAKVNNLTSGKDIACVWIQSCSDHICYDPRGHG
jgi:hypothetical protein